MEEICAGMALLLMQPRTAARQQQLEQQLGHDGSAVTEDQVQSMETPVLSVKLRRAWCRMVLHHQSQAECQMHFSTSITTNTSSQGTFPCQDSLFRSHSSSHNICSACKACISTRSSTATARLMVML